MDPRSLHDSQFRLIHILYQDDGFTIAFGIWEDDTYLLAMRWDGEGDAAGYPVGRGGRPKWFVVQRELSWPILCSLMAAPVINKVGANVSAVVAALNVLDAERAGRPEEIEGNVHVSRLDDPTALEPWAYAVTFAAFGDRGGAAPARKIHGDDELRKLLLDGVGIALPALVDNAIKRVRDEGHATITHVRLSPEQKRALAL